MNWIKNGVTLVLAVLFALIVAEFITRVLLPLDLSGSWRVVDDHGLLLNKSSGTSVHQRGDRKAIYKFESNGVRSTSIPTSPHDKRVLILGDSFTFGWLLSTADTYVYNLAKKHNDKRFYNAAAGGWGTADYTAYLETYCRAINPGITLVFMNADDIGRMHRSTLYKSSDELDALIRQPFQPTMSQLVKKTINSFPGYQFLLTKSHLIQLIRKIGLGNFTRKKDVENVNQQQQLAFGMNEGLSPSHSIQLASLFFKHLSDVASSCGTQLKIVYIGVQEKNSAPAGFYPTLNFIEYAGESNFFTRLQVSFLDLSETRQMKKYRESLDTFTIVGDGHPNELGAQLIFEALDESNILE
jgi:hypothetical protein